MLEFEEEEEDQGDGGDDYSAWMKNKEVVTTAVLSESCNPDKIKRQIDSANGKLAEQQYDEVVESTGDDGIEEEGAGEVETKT